MPLDPELWTTEADQTNVRASLDDPELAELDFEGQAEREAAAPPETPAAPSEPVEEGFEYEDEQPINPAEMWRALQNTDPDDVQEQAYEAGLSAEDAVAAQQFFEELQELAESDPLQAVDYLAQVYAEQVQAQLADQYRQELAPVQAAHYQATAAGTLEQLAGELGRDVVLANSETVARMISADEGHYTDPATQQDRVRAAFIAAEHDRQAAYARGDDVHAEIGALPEPRRDAFGLTSGPGAEPAHRAAPPAAQPAATAAPRPADKPVHIEGGSTPPPFQSNVHVDPVIAEMDEAGPGKSDMFGRIFR